MSAIDNKKEILKEYIIQDMVAFLVEDKNIDISEAMMIIYTSDIYNKLFDSKTGLYLESSAYVYDLLKDECKNGKIIQNEI